MPFPHVGIDVSAKTLDCCINFEDGTRFEAQFSNDSAGHRKLIAKLQDASSTRVLMEATGGLHRPLARALENTGLHADARNPLMISELRKGLGRIEKSDRSDARVMASIAGVLAPGPRRVRSDLLDQLEALNTLRSQLVEQHTACVNQRKAAEKAAGGRLPRFLKTTYARMEKANEREQKRVEAEMNALIEGDAKLARARELMLSMPGVGNTTACILIAGMPELGQLGPKQASKLAGLAPITSQSGEVNRQAKTRGGRSIIRKALYFAALTACRCNEHFKAMYRRKLAEGKAKKSALIAVAHKQLIMLNAMLRDDAMWQPQRNPAPASASANAVPA